MIRAVASKGVARKTPGDSGQLLASQQAEQNEQRRNGNALFHEERVQDVVLEHPVGRDERHDPEHVPVAAQPGDPHHQQCGSQRPEHGDELEGATRGRKQKAIRQTEERQHDRVADGGGDREEYQRPDVPSEKDVEIGCDVSPHPPMPMRPRPAGKLLTQRWTVRQHEAGQDGQQRDQHQTRSAGQDSLANAFSHRRRGRCAAVREVITEHLNRRPA